MPYEAVRSDTDSDAALLAFLQSTYEAAASREDLPRVFRLGDGLIQINDDIADLNNDRPTTFTRFQRIADDKKPQDSC